MSDKLLERIAVALEKLAGNAPLPSASAAASAVSAAATAPKSPTKEPPAGKGAAAPGLKVVAPSKPPAGGKQELGAAREAVIGWLRKVKAAAGGAATVGRILTEAGASNIGTLKPENFEAVIEACKQELEDAPAGDTTGGATEGL
jgi:hypothetical protein